MPRFKLNRWSTLILTLCLGCAFLATMTTSASAQARMFDELGSRNWSGNGNPPPPPGEGDPDIPMSSLKRAQPIAGSGRAAQISTVRVAGDGAHVDSVMMWRFQAVLQSLGLWSFGRF